MERIEKVLKVKNLKRKWDKVREGLWTIPSPCPFRSVAGCSIYKDRPVVCKYFPLQRVQHEGFEVVGISTALCDAGQKCIKYLQGLQQ